MFLTLGQPPCGSMSSVRFREGSAPGRPRWGAQDVAGMQGSGPQSHFQLRRVGRRHLWGAQGGGVCANQHEAAVPASAASRLLAEQRAVDAR